MEFFITVIFILFAHYIADFVLQTEHMKTKKSESVGVLVGHVALYTLVFFSMFLIYGLIISYFSLTVLTTQQWFQLAIGISIVNGLLHYLIDYITSQLNKWLWNTKRINLFFISIGFDQFLHTSLLVFSFAQMVQNFGYVQ